MQRKETSESASKMTGDLWSDMGHGSRRCHVLLPLPLGSPYDYAVADGMTVVPGAFVLVPLGRRQVRGVVWGLGPADPDNQVDEAKLKPVTEIYPVRAMPETTRRFIEWLAEYTCNDLGATLRLAMSMPSALEAPAPKLAYELAGPPPDRMTPARGRVIEVLRNGPAETARAISERAGVGVSVVRGLLAAGTLAEVQIPAEGPLPLPDWRRPGPTLNSEQQTAAQALVAATAQQVNQNADQPETDGYTAFLLDGITGAGKTEVYFEAIAKALEMDRQVAVLLPEIALTAQWLERFQARFGVAPTVWHSDLRQVERRRHWRAVADGRARVVVGARSALFLPYCELGLIIVDEEHDQAFKQEDGVIYHARDMAVVRASLEKIPIILSSATPSLESLINAAQNKYQHLRLTVRAGDALPPEIIAIDMRRDTPPRGQWLAAPLIDAVTAALDAGEQALLFLNRRGYAPLTLCRTCGHRLECPNCSAWLVEHRFQRRLQCHHCGYAIKMPKACPECAADDSLAACGPGVERLLEEVQSHWPEARSLIMASDTIHGPQAAAEAIGRISAHEVDLVVGTQIIAKGHHFPMLTVVGVVDADLGLSGGDLRAAERTYQMLTQVAGRSGRAERPGRAYLQTYQPEHAAITALQTGDRDKFVATEVAARQNYQMPPFARLVALILSGPDEAEVMDAATHLARIAPRRADLQVIGPAPAPLALLRGRFRYRLLLKTGRQNNAGAIVRAWLADAKLPNQVRLNIDVDPHNFL